MELRLETPIKFRHPCYEALTWFAAKDYIKELNSYAEKGISPPIYLLEGMKEMLYCFSMWTRSREASAASTTNIPNRGESHISYCLFRQTSAQVCRSQAMDSTCTHVHVRPLLRFPKLICSKNTDHY